ncbi:MAG: bifunctional demethylmenaquinone methyltransferase/2-methoxy-6-polyprenyl-1,4-benzoquinol methylase UbiE [Desulfobacterales bacterium]|nr:MAG: bifunctional demethylmenaquinone methyltransferase/2-methoxy-6-polyprenyl-1,4-benzoquinol methylase UbiE [Desulfobacterales bacterium]
MKKKSKWLDEYSRPNQNAGQQPRQEKAYFGYRRVPAHEKAQWVRDHFNTVAKRYDLMNTLLSLGIHHLWKRTAVRTMALNPGDRVLDVCGGTGDLAILAARYTGESGQIIVYDINRAMIEAGRHKIHGSLLRKCVWFVQGDAEHLPFPDGYFDAAMVGFGIRNVTHMDLGFNEMCRILKPGAKMMCLEFSKPTAPLFRWLYDLYSFYFMPLLGGIVAGSYKAYLHLTESIRTFVLPDKLTDMIERAGFSRITIRKLTNGIAIIHMATKD